MDKIVVDNIAGKTLKICIFTDFQGIKIALRIFVVEN